MIDNSAAHCPTVLKYDSLAHYGFPEDANCENTLPVKSNMVDGVQIVHI